MSIAGGLHNAFYSGQEVGCDCLQVFVKNQRQWSARPLLREDVRQWNHARRATKLDPVMAHAAYLINLASSDRLIRRRSVEAFIDELNRCDQLGIRHLIVHPGSHVDAGETAGLTRVVRAIDEIHDRTADLNVRILVETTAGQGTSLGWCFEHLAEIIGTARQPERIGVCLDTCHVHAAGYDMVSDQGYRDTIRQLGALVGLKRVMCIHVNDSKGGRGSRVDRHEHIGKGTLGRAAFANVVHDPRFMRVPKIIETPKGFDTRGRNLDKQNLACLRRITALAPRRESWLRAGRS